MSTKLSTIIAVQITTMVDKKRTPVGNVQIPCPALADFGIDAKPTKTNEDGSLVYGNDTLNWMYGAMKQVCLAKARNQLEPGTTNFKPSVDNFAQTVEELCAPALMGGNPEAAQAITAFKRSFKEYLAGLGLAAGAQAFINAQVTSPKALALQPEGYRAKIEVRLNDYCEWAGENEPEVLNTYAVAYITKLAEACKAEEIDLGDL